MINTITLLLIIKLPSCCGTTNYPLGYKLVTKKLAFISVYETKLNIPLSPRGILDFCYTN